MYCLLRLLPLIIGEYVPVVDPVWDILLKFLYVMDIVCAREISMADVLMLEDHITDFLQVWLNADETLTPKFHF